MKLKSALIVAAVASAFSVSAQAATTIFSDTFDLYPTNNPNSLNWAPQGGWLVGANGTVDLIGEIPVVFYNEIPGKNNYIDLDGSTNASGLFSNSVNNLTGGITYTLSFDLAGSQRGDLNTVDVNFGDQILTINNIASAAGFSTYYLNFTPGSNGTYSFSFQNRGGDNVGALLDNVTVTAVPEPESYAMIMAGLGLMGFIVRRRKTGQV
jgi:hypothetical protein